MGSGLAGEGDQERERRRSRDGKAGREGFSLAVVAGASSNRTFHDPTHMAYVWNRQHQKRYDFFDYERARDARLKKIEELYRGYKVKLYRGWLEHQRDTPEELIP
ncbi:hypothetical protein COCNU_06G009120 [Cocos nucifera]|uniref:Uncharacterized protein n=1 Tax=Cocos nucifera TaxID=13894 RepID=A0A8K0IB26_COCNU|nr:hypothetical protein COCNU_06G009120 [Cocos nucifera]